MGLFEPKTTSIDPNPDVLKPLQGQQAQFLQQLFANPGQSPFAGMTSPLQRQATGQISNFINQPSPEQQTFQQLLGPLMGLAQGGQQGGGISNAQFGQGMPIPGFDPNTTFQGGGNLQPQIPGGGTTASDVGSGLFPGPQAGQTPGAVPGSPLGAGFSAGQAVVDAAQPIFERNLDFAQGRLANSAPGRFSSAFAGQGIGLGQQALQDFNLFANQALQQGVSQDIGRENNLMNFALGNRDIGLRGQLGASGLLGQLASQAGQNPFQRLLGAGGFGQGNTQQQINPMLQLLMGGLQFGRPQGKDTVVGQSPFGQIANLGLGLGTLFGGGSGN